MKSMTRDSGASNYYVFKGFYFPTTYSSNICTKGKELLKDTFVKLRSNTLDLPTDSIRQLSLIARAACGVFYGQNGWTTEDVDDLVTDFLERE